jgi:integrase
VYVFCCYSGLAYIDVQAFDPIKNIATNKHGKFIVHSRSKTNVEYCVPVSKPIEDILLKYPEKLPTISNQKYNENLKKVMRLAGIARNLTSHSARKTFAMMAHNDFGVPIDTVSKMLGHTSVQTTQAYYAKTDFQKVANDMREALRKMA